MLDDQNYIREKDPDGALAVAATEWKQAGYDGPVAGDLSAGGVTSVVISGMGGSALAALLARSLYDEIGVPFEVSRGYHAPRYAGPGTLFVASSYSGNTEETLGSFEEAVARGAHVVVIASGGELIRRAVRSGVPYLTLPGGIQPRMATLYGLRALTTVLAAAGLVAPSRLDELAAAQDFLRAESAAWGAESIGDDNLAKTLAFSMVGKTPVIYGGPLTAPLAYKWKISINENAKNTAFWNEYPEFNHNEFIGWTSHPVEKPFAPIDLISPLEHPQVFKRFALSDRLLSGKRPKSRVVDLKGSTLLEQLLWGCILADFTTIYLAILNGVNPVPVALIEKLKAQL